MYGVVLFHTTSSAMRAEKELMKAGISVRMIPTPRQFSSDCGFALRFHWEQLGVVRELLGAGRVETAGVHELE